MRTFSRNFAIVPIIACCVILSHAQTPFKSAELISASDIQSPSGSGASGIVVLDVTLDEEGNITGIVAPRTINPLTSVATAAVRTWKFKPASLHSARTSSDIRIAFVFRPRVVFAGTPVFEPLLEVEDSSAAPNGGYQPPGIQTVAYPAYPIDAANVGAVVVQARISEIGKADLVSVLRAFNPFTTFALEAAKKWKFHAASLNGKPIPSKIVVAFVFSAPAISY
jgi:hypothetical protein